MIGIIILLILLYIRYHNRYIESFTNIFKNTANNVSKGTTKVFTDTKGLANDAGRGAAAGAGAAGKAIVGAGKAIVGAGEVVGGDIKDGLGNISDALEGAWPPTGLPNWGSGLTCDDGDGKCKLACIIEKNNIDECITSKIGNMVTKFKTDLDGLFTTDDWVIGKMPNVSSSSANFSLGYSSGNKKLVTVLENMTDLLLNFKDEFWKNLARPIETVTTKLWDKTMGKYVRF